MKNMAQPTLQRILETALYVDELERSIHFYKEVMGLEPLHYHPMDRLCAFSVGGTSILLIFQRNSTTEPLETSGGIIPSHNGFGPLHMAFAIKQEDFPAWKKKLVEHGVEILSHVKWPRGGASLYFRDPDQHLIELATPGLWSIY